MSAAASPAPGSASPATGSASAATATPPPSVDPSAAVEPTTSPDATGSTHGAPARAYVVAVVGDSLTDRKSHGGGFVRELERRCPQSRFDNFGKGADMVNQMRRRFRSELYRSGAPSYTHVIVFGGVNDLYSDLTAKRSNDKIEADLGQMYDWAKQGGAKVVAVAVTPWGGFTRYYNQRRGENTLRLNRWMRDQVGERVDHFVDAYALLACGERLCPEFAEPYRDGIHFGRRGHEALGEALFSAVFSDCL